MSRTDAHRPLDVLLRDEPARRVEIHDHRSGECTLPDDPSHGWRPAGCYWTYDFAAAPRICACEMCSGRFSRKAAYRARRAAERVWLRMAARGADLEWLEAHEPGLDVTVY